MTREHELIRRLRAFDGKLRIWPMDDRAAYELVRWYGDERISESSMELNALRQLEQATRGGVAATVKWALGELDRMREAKVLAEMMPPVLGVVGADGIVRWAKAG